MQFKSPLVSLFPLVLIGLFAIGCSSKESPQPDAAPQGAAAPSDGFSADAPIESAPAKTTPVQDETATAPADEPSVAVEEEPKEKWPDQPSLFRSLGNALGRGFQNAVGDKKEDAAEGEDAEEKDSSEKDANKEKDDEKEKDAKE